MDGRAPRPVAASRCVHFHWESSGVFSVFGYLFFRGLNCRSETLLHTRVPPRQPSEASCQHGMGGSFSTVSTRSRTNLPAAEVSDRSSTSTSPPLETKRAPTVSGPHAWRLHTLLPGAINIRRPRTTRLCLRRRRHPRGLSHHRAQRSPLAARQERRRTDRGLCPIV